MERYTTVRLPSLYGGLDYTDPLVYFKEHTDAL